MLVAAGLSFIPVGGGPGVAAMFHVILTGAKRVPSTLACAAIFVSGVFTITRFQGIVVVFVGVLSWIW